jgi:hypothetical protein
MLRSRLPLIIFTVALASCVQEAEVSAIPDKNDVSVRFTTPVRTEGDRAIFSFEVTNNSESAICFKDFLGVPFASFIDPKTGRSYSPKVAVDALFGPQVDGPGTIIRVDPGMTHQITQRTESINDLLAPAGTGPAIYEPGREVALDLNIGVFPCSYTQESDAVMAGDIVYTDIIVSPTFAFD